MKLKMTTSETPKGSKFEQKNEALEYKFLKRKQHCAAVAVAVMVS